MREHRPKRLDGRAGAPTGSWSGCRRSQTWPASQRSRRITRQRRFSIGWDGGSRERHPMNHEQPYPTAEDDAADANAGESQTGRW